MTGTTAFIYHPDYLKYQFGPRHPFQPIREKYTLDLLQELEVFDEAVKLHEPKPCKEEDLFLVHSEEYVNFVRKMCEIGYGYLDQGDTPAVRGLYEGACSVVGGTLLGVKMVMEGDVNHAFNLGGGLHHAKKNRASGFCVFNDVAIAVRFLQKKYNLKKIAIVDVDGHHGDGTQEIFYNEKILKISTHRIGIFPGTGNLEEVGTGLGKGYSVNIPLPKGTDNVSYSYAFNEVILPLIEHYEPDFIVTQCGVDGHYQDPLVGLALTTKIYEEIGRKIHHLAHKSAKGRLLVLGGGGYNVHNAARCWTAIFINVSEALPKISEKKYREILDKDSSNKNIVLENVKKTVEKVKREIFPLQGL